jgi:hypothetical protein
MMGSVIVDGVWRHPQEVVSANDVDRIVASLGQVVALAQTLSDVDQRRVRDFVRATLAMLEATTSLPKSDQTMFETMLRDAVRK